MRGIVWKRPADNKKNRSIRCLDKRWSGSRPCLAWELPRVLAIQDDQVTSMKYLAIPLLAALASGCAKSDFAMNNDAPPTLENLAKACVKDRHLAIRHEWTNYERRYQRQVVFPDWRAQAVSWARLECDHGRVIAQFRP
jgi:hypothetical protein